MRNVNWIDAVTKDAVEIYWNPAIVQCAYIDHEGENIKQVYSLVLGKLWPNNQREMWNTKGIGETKSGPNFPLQIDRVDAIRLPSDHH